MANLPTPQVSAATALRDLIPALFAQVYLVGLVASGNLDYIQATVGIMAEMLLGLLISVSFLSPNMKTLGSRTGEFVVCLVIMAMFLVAIIYIPHTNQPQRITDEMALRSLSDIRQHLVAMASYLFVGFAFSMVMAKLSCNAAFWWYRNVTSVQVGVTFFALFIGIFLSLPIGMLVAHFNFPAIVYGVAWIGAVALLRLALIFLMTRYLSQTDWQTQYRKYMTGDA